MATTVISFGHLHGPAPQAHLIVDLRQGYRNPAPHLPADLAFPAPEVVAHVISTSGISDLVDALVLTTDQLARVQDEVVVAVGCAGGQHRAPTVASPIADQNSPRARRSRVSHRDLNTSLT